MSFPKRHSLRPVPAFQTKKMPVADGNSTEKTLVKGELGLWLRVLMDVVASEGGPSIGRDEHCKETKSSLRGSGIYAALVYIDLHPSFLMFDFLNRSLENNFPALLFLNGSSSSVFSDWRIRTSTFAPLVPPAVGSSASLPRTARNRCNRPVRQVQEGGAK